MHQFQKYVSYWVEREIEHIKQQIIFKRSIKLNGPFCIITNLSPFCYIWRIHCYDDLCKKEMKEKCWHLMHSGMNTECDKFDLCWMPFSRMEMLESMRFASMYSNFPLIDGVFVWFFCKRKPTRSSLKNDDSSPYTFAYYTFHTMFHIELVPLGKWPVCISTFCSRRKNNIKSKQFMYKCVYIHIWTATWQKIKV